MQIEPIARVRSAYPTKFGVPRQPGLADALVAEVVFEPAYRNPDAVRGLEGFDYVWLLWAFSMNERPSSATCGTPAFAPTVRPPILGGTRRMGVFATRSSFRPNNLALSCVRLLELVPETPEGPVLRVAGADAADGTPVFDVKPYLPYVDAHPEARAGWTQDVRWPVIERVSVPEPEMAKLPERLRAGLLQVLRQDPRPAYVRGSQEGRLFWVPLERWVAWFSVRQDADGPALTVARIDELSDAAYAELRATGTVRAFEEGSGH